MSKTIGRFQIIARLDRGRLGAVFRAFDPEQQRQVALRLVRRPSPADARQQESFVALQGALRAAVTLDHPGIAAVYEHGETEFATEAGSTGAAATQVLYIASALVDGTPLAFRLSGGRCLPPGPACQWLTQILLALDHAHGLGVVHGSLDPANVLITAADEVRLTDFGLGSCLSAGTAPGGSRLDTPAYLAPEQLLGEAVDARSDLFAAGVLLYRMLVGRQPFEGGAAEVMQQILAQDAPPPSRSLPNLGTAFDGVVAQALARRPDRRFASADQFLLALNRAMVQHAAAQQEDATAILPAEAIKPIVLPGPVAPAVDWKQAAAPQLEAALIDVVGPVSRAMVRRALANAGDFDSVCADLAGQIREPVARQAFVAAAQQAKAACPAQAFPEPTESRAPDPPTRDSLQATPSSLVDPETLQMVTDRLSEDVGPMARIIVDRSVAATGSRAEFFRLLAKWIPTEQGQQDFLRDFRVGE
ncbi:MAG: serine/threonine protein kinase [Rhizobacter sp.]|nr:serine/threonine protein kinase [Rhizobacter sp.]